MPRCLLSWVPFFDSILIVFRSIWAPNLDPPNLEINGFSQGKTTILQKSAFRKIYRIFFDFDVKLLPFSFPKSIKIFPKIDPTTHQFFNRLLDGFFMDVGSILKANLGPCWLLKPIRNRPRRPQDTLRSHCFDFSAPRPHLGTILPRFWMVLESMLEGFRCPRAAKTF